ARESGQTNLLNPYAHYPINEGKEWVIASDDVDMYFKHGTIGRLTSYQIQILEDLKKKGQIRLVFNTAFFTHSDSREPELAGIWGGLVGSLFTLFITFLTAFPLVIGTAL